jgi:hypothetical protein
MEVIYSNLSEKLLEVAPVLREAYEEERKIWEEEPGPHIIYGDILAPHIISLLESGGRSEDLRQIFRFLEELAGHPDIHVQEVVAFSVIERLTDNSQWLDRAYEYMGPKTREIVREVKEFWGIA